MVSLERCYTEVIMTCSTYTLNRPQSELIVCNWCNWLYHCSVPALGMIPNYIANKINLTSIRLDLFFPEKEEIFAERSFCGNYIFNLFTVESLSLIRKQYQIFFIAPLNIFHVHVPFRSLYWDWLKHVGHLLWILYFWFWLITIKISYIFF